MYRLEDLGWLQFQRLGEMVVGLEGWSGSADRSRELVSEVAVRVPGSEAVLPGPVLVQIRWRRRREFADAEPLPAGVASRLVVSNAERGGEATLGVAELSALLDARPELRLRLPSVLGLRDLAPLLDAEELARAAASISRARASWRACSCRRAPTGWPWRCSSATASPC